MVHCVLSYSLLSKTPFFHGFEADDLNALIEIKIVEKDQNLVIEITDNVGEWKKQMCGDFTA